MRTLRRFLVVVALAFWLGGFTFYVSVVVPIGTHEVGSAFLQGMITREVTVILNVSGAAALLPLLWDALVGDRVVWRLRARQGIWLFLAACQAALFVLHPRLDAMMDPETMTVSDGFHLAHRAYLWLHTLQWGAALAFIVLMLKGWSAEDRGGGEKESRR